MPARFNAWLCRSSSFCFCVPVRAGFVLVSTVTFLLSGAVSTIIWFEIFHSFQLTTKERVAFYLAGIVESILFLASIIGVIGVVARKQLFVMLYAYFLYVHFLINLIVGIYFLVTVRHSNRQQLVDYCSEVFENTSLESSCAHLMGVSTYVFIAIVGALLLLELYGTLIAARYVHRLRTQKREDRSRRLGYFHALSKPETRSTRHVRQPSDHIELLHSRESTGDPQDPEDVVLDIAPPSYMPVSTHDSDLPLDLASSPPYPSDTSGHHIRALPPRPVVAPSPVATKSCLQERTAEPGRLPNPHEPTRERQCSQSEEDAEVSTGAHAALMDHATYMESRFASVAPDPRFFSRSLE